MSKALYFYTSEIFYQYKEYKLENGFEIKSISSILTDLESVNELDYNNVIIDISVITEYQEYQRIMELTIDKFHNNQKFICDIKKEEIVKYNLRFVFDKFEMINDLNFETKSKNKKKNTKPIEKKHRKIIDLVDNELNDFFTEFDKNLYGHYKFKEHFKTHIKTFKIFNQLGEHKILSFFLMGESGVGKTEVARTIYKSLKGKTKLAKINLGNYSSETSLNSLIGASRGYINSEDGDIFIKVRNTDIGILLMDEFEKANSTIYNYFLDVLETGIIESSLGEQIDLNGFILIFTSNMTKDDFYTKISPELRSRFDLRSTFSYLSQEDKEKFVEYRVSNIVDKISSKLKLNIDNNTRQKIQDSIDVNQFTNLRHLNKTIKSLFLEVFENLEKK